MLRKYLRKNPLWIVVVWIERCWHVNCFAHLQFPICLPKCTINIRNIIMTINNLLLVFQQLVECDNRVVHNLIFSTLLSKVQFRQLKIATTTKCTSINELKRKKKIEQIAIVAPFNFRIQRKIQWFLFLMGFQWNFISIVSSLRYQTDSFNTYNFPKMFLNLIDFAEYVNLHNKTKYKKKIKLDWFGGYFSTINAQLVVIWVSIFGWTHSDFENVCVFVCVFSDNPWSFIMFNAINKINLYK